MTTLAVMSSPGVMGLIVGVVLMVLFVFTILVKQYKRCPSNRILVKYGRVGSQQAAQCIHGGATFVVPLFQSYEYISLEPMTIDIDLTSALSKKNIRVSVPSTFTIGISTEPSIMNNAAERLLGLRDADIAHQARDIILGQMRLVIATLSIEEINQDREKFLDLVNKNVGFELNKIGLDVINVNIRDITDESGYIEAIGKKAASEAINTAKVEVAEQDKMGAIGESTARRAQTVQVAEQSAQAAMGEKQAERDQRVTVSKLEAEGIAGEAQAGRDQEIAVAKERALAVQGTKQADAEKRVRVAELEAQAVEGENKSRASIAEYNASLAEREAAAQRRGEVAKAEATRDILRAEKDQELARLERDQLAAREIEKTKTIIDAEAEAESARRVAQGEADAVLAKYKAEAEGVQAVLEAKAAGYERLIKTCGDQKHLAPTLLVVEKLPELVAEQVKAIQNLQIDKITVWDSGGGADGSGSTSNFLKSLIGSLPPVHELAKQAGVELPDYFGSVEEPVSVDVTPTDVDATEA